MHNQIEALTLPAIVTFSLLCRHLEGPSDFLSISWLHAVPNMLLYPQARELMLSASSVTGLFDAEYA